MERDGYFILHGQVVHYTMNFCKDWVKTIQGKSTFTEAYGTGGKCVISYQVFTGRFFTTRCLVPRTYVIAFTVNCLR